MNVEWPSKEWKEGEEWLEDDIDYSGLGLFVNQCWGHLPEERREEFSAKVSTLIRFMEEVKGMN